MKSTILFATDPATEETIISESQKGSNQVQPIGRIHRTQNELLYQAAVMLTAIARSPQFDAALFKAMDKVCVLMYERHMGNA